MTNPKLFAAMGLIFAAGIVLSIMFGGIIRSSTPQPGSARTDIFGRPLPKSSGSGGIQQANEAPDVPRESNEAPDTADGSRAPNGTAGSVEAPPAKRYAAVPAMSIDPARRYTAVISTLKGDISLELYPDQAPLAVNSFIFLAQDGYYNGTPLMVLVKNKDGSPFSIQAGDPTRTGLGTPGFSVKKENTSKPFVRGALGMGGTSPDSNGGQFFISLGDYPVLTGKYTIFGQVIAGGEILERLDLFSPSSKTPSSPDVIQSVTITES